MNQGTCQVSAPPLPSPPSGHGECIPGYMSLPEQASVLSAKELKGKSNAGTGHQTANEPQRVSVPRRWKKRVSTGLREKLRLQYMALTFDEESHPEELGTVIAFRG